MALHQECELGTIRGCERACLLLMEQLTEPGVICGWQSFLDAGENFLVRPVVDRPVAVIRCTQWPERQFIRSEGFLRRKPADCPEE
jgi:hypothetical protein